MEKLQRMAKAWCVYNGQRATTKQIEKFVKMFFDCPEQLEYMLKQRNIKF